MAPHNLLSSLLQYLALASLLSENVLLLPAHPEQLTGLRAEHHSQKGELLFISHHSILEAFLDLIGPYTSLISFRVLLSSQKVDTSFNSVFDSLV